MKMHVISRSNDTLAGFRLGGVVGTNVRNEKQLEACLDLLLGDSDTGIILISQDIYEMGRDIIARKMRDRRLPLLVTIE
ncbi:MAG: V-type ATP synthase subunit F [Clostridia bacterium]